MLIDEGDRLQPGFFTSSPQVQAACRLREWLNHHNGGQVAVALKKPEDMMTIKNYEAMRLMVTAKFLEEKEDWQNAAANIQMALDIMEKELKAYLGGIRHTVHIQTEGFGLGDGQLLE
jgi:hypothetical protein